MTWVSLVLLERLPDEEKIKSTGMIDISKHKHSISSVFFFFFFSFFFRVISFNPFWKFIWLGNSAWDLLGVNFWSRDFLGSVGSPRDFLSFDFCPHSIILVT